MPEIALAIAVFVAVVMSLTLAIIAARARLVPTGEVAITINERRTLSARVGGTLLGELTDAGVRLPSACGGKGTCGLCRVRVLEGGGALRPVEAASITAAEAAAGERFACQVPVKRPMTVMVPDEVLGARQWTCVVRSCRSVTAMIREIILELPEEAFVPFRAGAFVQVTCPAYRLRFRDLSIDPAYHAAWDRLELWPLEAAATAPTTRAYSMANAPVEEGIIMLNVRLALPPSSTPEGTPPGIVSSYLFGLEPGDRVTISGPYGHFLAQESDREMVFIGGGAGMAPMRAHIIEQLRHLHTDRVITFWYGARSRADIFYQQDFDRLQQEFENFRWTVALSEPRTEDGWDGPVGFIHQVVYDRYLQRHPAPEECEYYLCGPPVMVQAVRNMLDSLGVEPESIFYDDFGG